MPRPRRRLVVPRRISIRGSTWRVRVAARLPAGDDGTPASGARGRCDRTTRTIWIWSGQSREEREQTFLHELVHALAGERDPEAQERIVCRLEAPLHALLLSGQLVAVPVEEVP